MVDLRKSTPPPSPRPSLYLFHLPSPSLSFILAECCGRGKKEKRKEEKGSQSFDIICSINNTFSAAPPRHRRRRGSSINKAARRTLYRDGGAHAKKTAKKKEERDGRLRAFFAKTASLFLSTSRAQRQIPPSVGRSVGQLPAPIQAAVNIKGAASVVFQLIACLPPPSASPPLLLLIPPPPSLSLAGSQHAGGVEPEAVHLLQAGGAGHNDGRGRSRHRQDLPDPKHITSHSTP